MWGICGEGQSQGRVRGAEAGSHGMWDSDQALVTVKPSESRTNRKFPSRVCFAWIREYIRTSGLGVRTYLWIGVYVPLDWGVHVYLWTGGAYIPLD